MTTYALPISVQANVRSTLSAQRGRSQNTRAATIAFAIFALDRMCEVLQ